MFAKIQKIWNDHEEIFIYLLYGCLTTLANYLVYFAAYNVAGLSGSVSNIISWGAAVLVAFFTNKPFVFKSKDWSLRVVVPEFVKFVGCRVGSGVIETGIIFLTVDCLKWNGNVLKLICGVLVVILNYIFSHFFVFRKK